MFLGFAVESYCCQAITVCHCQQALTLLTGKEMLCIFQGNVLVSQTSFMIESARSLEAVDLLAQFVRVLHWYFKGQALNPGKLEFFGGFHFATA